MSNYKIWADGSSVDGNGGVGFVIEHDGKVCEYCHKIGSATASQAEILAVICALSRLENPSLVIICTDSQAVQNIIQKGEHCTGAEEQSYMLKRRIDKIKEVKVRLVRSNSGKHPRHDRCHVMALTCARGEKDYALTHPKVAI